MNEIYVVTGATGHLGNNIVRELINNNKKVRTLVLKNDDISMFENKKIEICYGDVRDKKSLEKLFVKKENEEIILIHSAGIVTIASGKNNLVEEVNVVGVKNIVDLAIKEKVKKFIYISSVHAIFEKENKEMISETRVFDSSKIIGLYAKSKAKATKHILESVKKGLNAIVLHPSGIVGPYDYKKSNTTALIEEYVNGKLTARVNGGYDFVDVRDVAKAVYTSTYKGKIGECYILSGHYITLKYFFDLLKIITKRKRKIDVLPLWFAKLTIPLAEFYYKILRKPRIFSKYSLHTLRTNSNFSNKKAKENLDFKTREFEETLKDTIAWLASQNRIKSRKNDLSQIQKRVKYYYNNKTI